MSSVENRRGSDGDKTDNSVKDFEEEEKEHCDNMEKVDISRASSRNGGETDNSSTEKEG